MPDAPVELRAAGPAGTMRSAPRGAPQASTNDAWRRSTASTPRQAAGRDGRGATAGATAASSRSSAAPVVAPPPPPPPPPPRAPAPTRSASRSVRARAPAPRAARTAPRRALARAGRPHQRSLVGGGGSV